MIIYFDTFPSHIKQSQLNQNNISVKFKHQMSKKINFLIYFKYFWVSVINTYEESCIQFSSFGHKS